MKLEGVFKITDWKETVEKNFDDGAKLSTAAVLQEYTGDILGKGELQYQMSYTANGNAHFVGFEVILGTIDGQAYRLTLKHDGCFENGSAKSCFIVTESYPESKLIGLAGRFDAGDDCEVNYSIG